MSTNKNIIMSLLYMLLCTMALVCHGEEVKTDNGTVMNTNNEVVSLNEDVKILKIKLRALTTNHELDVTTLKKNVERLRKEFVDIVSGKSENNIPNEIFTNNSENNELNPDRLNREISSFEWTHKAIDDIHEDMTLIESKVVDIKTEVSNMVSEKNKTDSFEAEIREKIKQLTRDSELAKSRADIMEKNNIRLWKRVKALEKNLIKKKYKDILSDDSPCGLSQIKCRHNRRRNELHNLRYLYWKVEDDNQNSFDQIAMIKNSLHNFDTIERRLNILEENHNINKMRIDSQIYKLHSSMLELLESVEAQEARIDKLVPEFQIEFSKLDVDVAQLNSHYNYMKSNQNSIRESVKAIAVSVSNVMQKISEDRVAIDKINVSTTRLEDQSKLHFHRLKDHISKVEEQHAQNATVYDNEFVPDILDKMKEMQEKYEDILSHLPTTCDAIKEKTGVYEIKPSGGPITKTHCSQGWTLMQARFNGSVEFNQNFKQYSAGFGDPEGEYWIGNEALYHITKDNCTMLRIEMVDIYNNIWVANYENIHVASEGAGYRLNVNGFTGNASDALEYQNNMEFSTMDRDRDISNTHCAADYEGGWWFSHCQHANLNGKYTLGLTWFDTRTNQWIAIKSSRMTIKTNPTCVNH